MSDFCLTRPMLSQVVRQAELMNRMMARLGIDAAAAVRLADMACYEARIRCLACNIERQCLHWLERSQAEWSAEPPEFCHNAEFFRRCRQRKTQLPDSLFCIDGGKPWLWTQPSKL